MGLCIRFACSTIVAGLPLIVAARKKAHENSRNHEDTDQGVWPFFDVSTRLVSSGSLSSVELIGAVVESGSMVAHLLVIHIFTNIF